MIQSLPMCNQPLPSSVSGELKPEKSVCAVSSDGARLVIQPSRLQKLGNKSGILRDQPRCVNGPTWEKARGGYVVTGIVVAMARLLSLVDQNLSCQT